MNRFNLKRTFIQLFGGYKSLLFLFILLIGFSLHYYTRQLVEQLREESHSLVELYANMYLYVAETESEDNLSFLFDQIIRKSNFPLIITDDNHHPIGWKGLSVDPSDRSIEAIKRVSHIMQQLAKEIDPVPVSYEGHVFNYLYYGDSSLVSQLQIFPYVEIGILGIFILLGFMGYANIIRSEKRHIWVGMAKETAHQLGTPISSLMGWIEVMKEADKKPKAEIFAEMTKDMSRLKQVSARFSEIGSIPDLKENNLREALDEVVTYISRRAPQLGRKVQINTSYEEVPAVALNSNLFQWAVENIMKNALDAMDKARGEIKINLFNDEKPRKVILDIEDNGKGIESKNLNCIFKPGHSTKKRGWGLGLTLSKRIIEDYHRGKIYVKESKPAEGTCIRIELKV